MKCSSFGVTLLPVVSVSFVCCLLSSALQHGCLHQCVYMFLLLFVLYSNAYLVFSRRWSIHCDSSCCCFLDISKILEEFKGTLGFRDNGVLGEFRLPSPPPLPKQKVMFLQDTSQQRCSQRSFSFFSLLESSDHRPFHMSLTCMLLDKHLTYCPQIYTFAERGQ